MMKLDGFAIFVALASAVIVFVFSVLAPDEMQVTEFASDPHAVTALCLWTLASLPFAFAMPRLRAGPFGRIWRVPRDTHILPRWIARLYIGAGFGQVAAFVALAMIQDRRIYWLAGSLALHYGVFCAGAVPRLKKHPRAEFPMRWWPPG